MPKSLPPFLLLVTGSRKYTNYNEVTRRIALAVADAYHAGYRELTFIHGGAIGADSLADEFINKIDGSIPDLKFNKRVIKPDYSLGKAAPLVRNDQMVAMCDPQHSVCIAFLQPGDKNAGTKYTIHAAKKRGLTVKVD